MLEKITVFLVLSVAQTAKAALQSFLYSSLSLAAAACQEQAATRVENK
jgi:hypothetical protein